MNEIIEVKRVHGSSGMKVETGVFVTVGLFALLVMGTTIAEIIRYL